MKSEIVKSGEYRIVKDMFPLWTPLFDEALNDYITAVIKISRNEAENEPEHQSNYRYYCE